MRFLRQLRSVLWSFVGVRRGADSARDLEGARLPTIVVAGLIVAAAFVLGIVGLVRLVTDPQAPPPTAGVRPASPPPLAGAQYRARHGGAGHDGRTRARLRRVPREATVSPGRVFSPRIAGKPAGYLYHQLLNFRDGRRP